MASEHTLFMHKAQESLVDAESELTNGRYNNCANRTYYACIQAAIFALLMAGIRPAGEGWSHAFVPSQFDGVLSYRRKLYPPELRGVLERAFDLRAKADYGPYFVTRTEAERVMRRARIFVGTIQTTRGDAQ